MKILKSIFFAALITFSLFLTSCAQTGGDKASFTNVQVADLKAKMGSEITILDVRTPNETGQGYVEGAVIIDFYSDHFIDEAIKLDKEKPIYVYCKVGGRSSKASKQLVENGFKSVFNVDGGFDAWKGAAYPQVK